jgi:flagellar motor protein MotB
MMSGLLFIFIITLVFFVVKYKSINKSLMSRDEIRQEILHTIEDKLSAMDVQKNLAISIDKNSGIITLRDKKDKLFFRSSEAVPEENAKMAIESLSDIFASTLSCYTKNTLGCSLIPIPAEKDRQLGSVFIEGHTDILKVRQPNINNFQDNWDLSTHRAMETYKILIRKNQTLSELKNQNEENVFSVSGYGATRRLSKGDSPQELALDRRIDFRLVMASPKANPLNIQSQLDER